MTEVKKHETGTYRAYKKIFKVEHQFYFKCKAKAQAKQDELEKLSRVYHSCVMPNLFNSCGRLVNLRVRKYKKTNKVTFQLQVSKGSKQVKVQKLIKSSFEESWAVFFKLWCNHFNLNAIDALDNKEKIKIAKRLYMQDVYAIEEGLIS